MTGLREWFAQTDERGAPPRIPVMVNMASSSVSSKKNQKQQEFSVHPVSSLDQINTTSRNSTAIMDEYSDEEDEFQIAEEEQEVWFILMIFCLCIILQTCFVVLTFSFNFYVVDIST